MRSLLLLVALGVAAVPSRVSADPKAEAAAHIAKAQADNEAGKYADALNELNVAYTLDPQPQLLYAIGQIHRQLGHCDEALVFYKRFLDTHPDRDSVAVTNEAMASCKNQPEPRHDQPPPPPPPPPHREPPPPPPASTPPFYSDAIGDALVGLGIAAGVVAIVEYRSATSDIDSANAATTFDARKKLEDDANSKRTLSVALAVGGIALVGGGIAHYMLHDRGPGSTGVAIVPVPGGGFVSWSGGF